MPQTGPVTPGGKRIASLNNIRHGLNINGILPCKGSKCCYYEICMVRIIQGEDYINRIPYGSPCPSEMYEYNKFKEAYSKYGSGDRLNKETNHNIALLLVRRERQRKYTAIWPEMIRKVPGVVANTLREGPSLSWRYRKDITPKLLRLMEQALLQPERIEDIADNADLATAVEK